MFTQPRFEFKYITSLAEAVSFQERLSEVMTPDPNTINQGYHVNSIYFDTHDLNFYYEKIDGEKHRFKIRIRWYGEINNRTDLSKHKLFIEIKHRNNDMSFKNRVSVAAKYLPDLAENQNQLIRLSEISGNTQLQEAILIERISSQKPLFPVCIVSYYRKPFICRINPRLRVTFDSNPRVLGVKIFFKPHMRTGQLSYQRICA